MCLKQHAQRLRKRGSEMDKVDAALNAIEAVHEDTGKTLEQTLLNLESLEGFIATLIALIKEDIQRNG